MNSKEELLGLFSRNMTPEQFAEVQQMIEIEMAAKNLTPDETEAAYARAYQFYLGKTDGKYAFSVDSDFPVEEYQELMYANPEAELGFLAGVEAAGRTKVSKLKPNEHEWHI